MYIALYGISRLWIKIRGLFNFRPEKMRNMPYIRPEKMLNMSSIRPEKMYFFHLNRPEKMCIPVIVLLYPFDGCLLCLYT